MAAHGIRVNVSAAAALMCAAICIFGGITPLFVIIGCALVHEAGHILVLKLYRVTISSIRIGISGAVIEHGSASYKVGILAAFAGPLSSFLLAVLLAALAKLLCLEYLYAASGVSASLGAFNMLPVYPLDGGRILFNAAALFLGEDRAYLSVRIVGSAFSVIILAFGIINSSSPGGKALIIWSICFLINYCKNPAFGIELTG